MISGITGASHGRWPMKRRSEFEVFSGAMNKILRADPDVVKAAMAAEKYARELETKRTGKRGRGRPPKHASSARVSSGKD
jgi:hypothetical protein